MQYVENTFQPFAEENEPWVCVVSHGELRSIAIQNRWGARKIQTLFEMLDDFLLIDIGSKDIYDRYAEIDAFSQGKLPETWGKMIFGLLPQHLSSVQHCLLLMLILDIWMACF